jgi:hypothetical protein
VLTLILPTETLAFPNISPAFAACSLCGPALKTVPGTIRIDIGRRRLIRLGHGRFDPRPRRGSSGQPARGEAWEARSSAGSVMPVIGQQAPQ